jgi:hypothetical protein
MLRSFMNLVDAHATCRAVCEEPWASCMVTMGAGSKHKFAGSARAKAMGCKLVAQIPNLLEVIPK